MLLSEMIAGIEHRTFQGGDPAISSLAYDSRRVEDGGAYFCIRGFVTDGHLYAAEAVSRGAVAVFAERILDEEISPRAMTVFVDDTREALAKCSSKFYGDPSASMKLIGITGTNGKTTTAYLVERIFRENGLATGLIGTVENHISGRVEPVVRTTPESLDLQRLFRRMVENGVSLTAMEVSSHALELHRVDGCDFDTVVFTNLTQDHLDFHLSLEEYFGAKRRLFEDGEFGTSRVALVNSDDQFGRRLLSETKLERMSFGIGEEADVRAVDVEVSEKGNRFLIVHRDLRIPVRTRLQGRFNVYNCVAAAAVGLQYGVDAAKIASGLESLRGVPGRFENIDCGQQFTAIVDYAHTPDGIRSLLEACREVAEGKVIIVVGCGGDRDRGKRSLMGRAAVEMSDICVITSDNPRSEDPEQIIEMILEGVRGEYSTDRYTVEPDRRDAIRAAVRLADSSDMVVVAGKGHESGQIFADRVIPFDDRQVLRDCIEEITGEKR
jgi:UDP-N-acetylmuramoyl-L-alanyl-D-glutamate--2,6-diaminopimelate ligase